MTIPTPSVDDKVPEWRRRTKQSLAAELAVTKDRLEWAERFEPPSRQQLETMTQMHHILAHTIRKFKEAAAEEQGGDRFIQLLDHIQDEVTAAQGGSAFRRSVPKGK